MRVRIINQPNQSTVDGVSLARFKPGLIYALPAPLATLMIVEGWALPIVESADVTLPDISFQRFPSPERRCRTVSKRLLRRELGIAADRRRH